MSCRLVLTKRGRCANSFFVLEATSFAEHLELETVQQSQHVLLFAAVSHRADFGFVGDMGYPSGKGKAGLGSLAFWNVWKAWKVWGDLEFCF